MNRYAVVFSCLIALFIAQLTRPVSSVAGAESSQPVSVSDARSTKIGVPANSARNVNSPSAASRQELERKYADLETQMAALKQQTEQPGADPKLWDQYEKIISRMNEIYSQIHKNDIESPQALEVSTCISGSLSLSSATFVRPNTISTGTGIGTCPGSTTVHYNIYQFNLTGCTTFPTQVTISLCGGSIASSGCATSSFDTALFLYRSGGSLTAGTGTSNPFNPSSPCTNLVAANDDLTGPAVAAGGSSCDGATCHPVCSGTGNSTRSGMIRSLGPGFFEVVVAGISGSQVGNFNLYVNAPGAGCSINAPTAVKLELVSATAYEDGVAIDWNTGREVDNLGFNVYRDVRGKRTLVTPQMLAGSALLAGPGTTLGAGQSYSWFDSQLQSKKAKYWLEEIDLSGQSTWHGPVSVTDSGNKNISPPRRGRNTLLSALNVSGGQSSSRPIEAKATPPEPTQSRLQVQSSLTSQKGVKLSVKQEGLYRVSQPDLVRAGLDPNVNPRMLQLYAGGQQVPIAEVNTASGRFDPSSAIEFFGQGIDSAVTDSHVYWLVAGSEPGLRIGQVADKVIPGKSTGQSFPYTVERKDRTIYFSSLRNGEKENFFGAVIARNPVDQALNLQHVSATASEAFVEVALQGVSLAAHRIGVQVNGAKAGEVSFNDQLQGIARFSIPQALLKEGQNLVTLVPQGEQTDVSLVDYIRITYQHSFTPDSDVLKFIANADQVVTVNGFSNPSIRLFDVTDSNNVLEVFGKIKQDKSGYSITATAPGQSQRTLLALTNGLAKSPFSIAASRGVNLRQEGPGADLFIITRADFFDGLKPLVALRQSQGFSVSVVDIEDIYDSFSFGQKTPQAIRDFLVYAKASYSTTPRYVLIAADASYDSKNYLGLGNKDIVPTKLIDTQFMETASDDWFVDSASGLGAIAIGRLPVDTAQEAASMAAKIVSYDQSNPSQEMLLVSDSNDAYDFERASAGLRALIPSSLSVEEIDRGQDGDAVAKSRLLDALVRGQKVVNYIGHGSVDQWKANLLTGADINNLQSEGSLPLFVMMTCLNGYFQDASLDSLAESLMKSPKGAIAVWASSGMTPPDVQLASNQELYRSLFDKTDASITLGDAIRKAKAFAGNADVRRTWILFGDPTMRIR